MHGVDDGLEEDALIFELCADEDEESGGGQDGVVEEESDEDGAEGEQLAEADEGAAGGSWAVGAGDGGAQEASGVERVGGQEVERAKKCLQPDGAAHQAGRGYEGSRKERESTACPGDRCGQDQGSGEVGYGSGEREDVLRVAGVGQFLALRVRVGE